jgi:hypothetical protein
MNIQDSMGMWMWGSFSFQAWPCGHDMNVQNFLLSIFFTPQYVLSTSVQNVVSNFIGQRGQF